MSHSQTTAGVGSGDPYDAWAQSSQVGGIAAPQVNPPPQHRRSLSQDKSQNQFQSGKSNQVGGGGYNPFDPITADPNTNSFNTPSGTSSSGSSALLQPNDLLAGWDPSQQATNLRNVGSGSSQPPSSTILLDPNDPNFTGLFAPQDSKAKRCWKWLGNTRVAKFANGVLEKAAELKQAADDKLQPVLQAVTGKLQTFQHNHPKKALCLYVITYPFHSRDNLSRVANVAAAAGTAFLIGSDESPLAAAGKLAFSFGTHVLSAAVTSESHIGFKVAVLAANALCLAWPPSYGPAETTFRQPSEMAKSLSQTEFWYNVANIANTGVNTICSAITWWNDRPVKVKTN